MDQKNQRSCESENKSVSKKRKQSKEKQSIQDVKYYAQKMVAQGLKLEKLIKKKEDQI
ncbi:MAG: hypothetical protein WBD28_00760 [Candidatus Zixiibacteriota bacterium]